MTIESLHLTQGPILAISIIPNINLNTRLGSFNNLDFSHGPGPPPNSTHSNPSHISSLLCEKT